MAVNELNTNRINLSRKANPSTGATAQIMFGSSADGSVQDRLRAMMKKPVPPPREKTVEEVQQRLSRRSKRLIDPRTSNMIGAWDLATTFALIFIAVATPWEVSFMPPSDSPTKPLFIINRLLDAIFLVDLVAQFFIVQATFDPENGMQWIDDHKLIVRHYLCSWFPLDLASLLVSIFDILPVVMRGEDGTNSMQSYSALRILRALRLLRLLRLSKLSRILSRWETRMAIRYSTLEIAKCLLLVIISAHWSACIFGLMAAVRAAASITSYCRHAAPTFHVPHVLCAAVPPAPLRG